MAYTPKPPFPKAPGNPIRAVDWNDAVVEVQRLETDKLDRSGGAVGALTVQGALAATGAATVSGAVSAGATLEVSGAATLRSATSVGGNLTVAGTAAVSGTSAVTGAATFGSTGAFAGAVRAGGAGAPQDSLDVAGIARLGSDANPLRITSQWSDFPAGAVNRAEISNDTNAFKTLMLVGNRSNDGGTRRVSVWDRLEVNGASCARSFCNLSDGRLKTDLRPVVDPLERLARLRGVTFRWRPVDSAPIDHPAADRATHGGVGVVAQEVAEVFPELVTTMGTEHHLAVDYTGLTAVLLEAVKALKADNDRLRQRVDALEAAGPLGGPC